MAGGEPWPSDRIRRKRVSKKYFYELTNDIPYETGDPNYER
jgi:hypothetical protein